MICRLLSSFIVLLALVPACLADRFLPADCTPLIELLPPPPADDSLAGRADLETVLQVQADLTPRQLQRVKRVASQSVTSFARPVLGEWFQPDDFPRTVALFEEISRESRKIIDDTVKKHWNRKRPVQVSGAVNPAAGRPTNSSYPSGHAAAAALWGTILSAAFPEKTAEFQAQIHEVMWCRVLGGAHFPTDTVAGQQLGEAIAKAMLNSPEMEAALKTIRDEISPHLHPPAKKAPQPSASPVEAGVH